MPPYFIRVAIMAVAWMTVSSLSQVSAGEAATSPLTVVVMDPLSAPLACDCVQGYAQRKYEQLGAFLQAELSRPVKVFWFESLEKALQETGGKADLIIGKDSVIRADAKHAKVQVLPIAKLTDKTGSTTQTGLIVVRKLDPALTVADLKGYRIFFGPKECEEKSSAPMRLLRASGVEVPAEVETSSACSVAAAKLMELDDSVAAAAVISSYAKPLLEGCGTIEKGDLRIIGISEEVPFITAFVHDSLPAQEREILRTALLKVGSHASLRKALETKLGFIAVKKK